MDKTLLLGISHNVVPSFLAAGAKKDYRVLKARKEKTKQFLNKSKVVPSTSLALGDSFREQ